MTLVVCNVKFLTLVVCYVKVDPVEDVEQVLLVDKLGLVSRQQL